MDGPQPVEDKAPSFITKALKTLSIRYQQLLDRSTPLTTVRWTVFGVTLVLFLLRVFLTRGWYIVTYALGIYLLNLLLAFLTPKLDPALAALEEEDEDMGNLPTSKNEEFRPFIRRLPEFKFWLSAQKGVLVSLFATLFRVFDVPVFWPILVLYFIILFSVSMKKQLAHMIKYKYVPFSFGKPKHRGKEDTGKVVRQ